MSDMEMTIAEIWQRCFDATVDTHTHTHTHTHIVNTADTDTQSETQEVYRDTLQHTATHCNTLQHTAGNDILDTGIQSETQETHFSTQESGNANGTEVVVVLGQRNCNTLQHSATKCNTLQHTVDGTDVAVGRGQLGPNDNW